MYKVSHIYTTADIEPLVQYKNFTQCQKICIERSDYFYFVYNYTHVLMSSHRLCNYIMLKYY